MAYSWDSKLHRYRDSTGKVVPDSQVRALVEDLIGQGKRELHELAASFLDGEMDVAEWSSESKNLIRRYQVAAAALARGGFAQMQPNDWGFIGAEIREQYHYFDAFAGEVAAALSGEAADVLTPAQVENRASQYASAAWTAQSRMEGRVARERGDTEERWVLSRATATSCRDCITLAASGWQPLGSLPEIGTQQCIFNCRCHKSYR